MKRKITHVSIEGRLYALPKEWNEYWLAQDKNGKWYVYNSRPMASWSVWFPHLLQSNIVYLTTGKPPKDFTKERYQLY